MSGWSSYWSVLRPLQWSKNSIALAGVVFSGQALQPDPAIHALTAMVAFCLASSAVYVFNDWHDREEDRRHPTKRLRPVASGDVEPGRALAMAAILAVISLAIWLAVSPEVAAIGSAYLALMAMYTIALRRLVLIDILAIAGGFLLRAWAGAAAVNVPLSVWLFVCTLSLALLLGLGKRRHELQSLHFDVAHHRPSLHMYARIDLDRVMVIVAIATLLVYAGYTLSTPSFGRTLPMVLTLPFAVAGVGRYLYLTLRRGMGGSPERLIVGDLPLFLSVACWSGAVAIILAS